MGSPVFPDIRGFLPLPGRTGHRVHHVLGFLVELHGNHPDEIGGLGHENKDQEDRECQLHACNHVFFSQGPTLLDPDGPENKEEDPETDDEGEGEGKGEDLDHPGIALQGVHQDTVLTVDGDNLHHPSCFEIPCIDVHGNAVPRVEK